MTEAQLHRQCADFLRVALGGSAWFTTIPLGGGGKIRGAILSGRGVQAGCPDILVIDGGRALWIELKSKRGRLSPDQVCCHALLRRAGAVVTVCRSLDEVIAFLTEAGVPLRIVREAREQAPDRVAETWP